MHTVMVAVDGCQGQSCSQVACPRTGITSNSDVAGLPSAIGSGVNVCSVTTVPDVANAFTPSGALARILAAAEQASGRRVKSAPNYHFIRLG